MIENKQYTRCLLDMKADPRLTFNHEGLCNHCLDYDKDSAIAAYSGDDGASRLQKLLQNQKSGFK